MRFWSIPKARATRCSCSWASPNGFSRRWVSVSSAVVTAGIPSLASLRPDLTPPSAHDEPDGAAGRAAPVGRVGDHVEHVRAAMQHFAGGAAAGEPKRVAAREQMALARDQPERLARAHTAQLEVETGHGQDLVA